MRLLLILLLIALIIGALPAWPYAVAWNVGYFPSGILGLILIIVLMSALVGRGDPTV